MVAEMDRVPARVLDRKVVRLEATAAWKRVHRLGQITHYAGTYDRPEWAQQAGAELVDLATKQLRMLEESGGTAS
jgi:hypothetical protein